MFPASERAKTLHALDCAATVIGTQRHISLKTLYVELEQVTNCTNSALDFKFVSLKHTPPDSTHTGRVQDYHSGLRMLIYYLQLYFRNDVRSVHGKVTAYTVSGGTR
jgi:hypothetical protein